MSFITALWDLIVDVTCAVTLAAGKVGIPPAVVGLFIWAGAAVLIWVAISHLRQGDADLIDVGKEAAAGFGCLVLGAIALSC